MFEELILALGIEIDFLLKICLAFLAGFAIGFEREKKGKEAGISTHSLVILGAMLFTFISSLVESGDNHRIAAGVVTGIGFLGAGVILKSGIEVYNLTTAASLWLAAAIGMAIGFGFYTVGILATLIAIPILRIPFLGDLEARHRNNDHEAKKDSR